MIIAVAIVSILVFLLAFQVAKVIPTASRLINTATDAMKIISSSEIDDEAKEKASRKAAINLSGGVVSLAIRSVVCIVAAAIPIYAAQAMGFASATDTIDFLLRWDVILASSIIIVLLVLVGRRLWSTK